MRPRFLRAPGRAPKTGLSKAVAIAAGLAAVIATASMAPAAAAPVPHTAAVAVAPAVAAAPASFTHPGVGVSKSQLDFVRTQVQAGAEPWKDAYQQMTSSTYASLSRTAKPRANVECGSFSMPNNGCTDERQDAIAAYTDALIWYIGGNDAYAQKSIELMDAWSATIQEHTNSNAPLQTAWAASSWARSAELIKSLYGNWPNEGRFATMLRNVYLPKIVGGSNSNGNWELTMNEAAQGISIFLDDKTDYDKTIGLYLTRVPAYIYLSSDGSLPKTVPSMNLTSASAIEGYWQGQTTFGSSMTGLTQETCRDFTHTGYGIAAIADVAETAFIQGQDLYPQVGERLRQALGFQTKFEQGAAVPSNLCGGHLNLGLGPVTEVGFNALHNRMGIAMTNTQAYTERSRPEGTNALFISWETLTNAENPDIAPAPGTTGTSTPPPDQPTGPVTGLGGKCLDVAGASTADNTPVQLFDCNGTAAQNWTVAADGTLQALGKCLDVASAGTANGTAVQVFDCNGTASQVWQRSGSALVNPQSGKCLDVTDKSTANGAKLQIWTCTGATNQQWGLPS
jgi:Ricin-type beta-trefoil lectin domain/Alginate lyase